MSQIPENLKYTKEHEWILIESDNCLVIGITDYAQQQLGDIVYVGLPQANASLNQGDAAVVIESVKAASDIHMPVTGSITAINEELQDNPVLINESPYEKGWLVKIKTDQVPELLSPAEYAKLVEEE